MRLDYENTEYKEIAEKEEDVYILRFVSDYCPDNSTYPHVDETQPWNNPPCTGQGFTGSEEAMIPEYTYGQGQDIKNGVIYKVDKDGNEYLAAIWDKRKARFKSV